jgi:hypothetical protein
MNRIGRCTIFAMLLILALAIVWNVMGGGADCQLPTQTARVCLTLPPLATT